MKKALLLLHLGMVLTTSCITSQLTTVDGVRPQLEPKTVKVSALPGGRLRLTFEPVESDLLLKRLRVEEAREVLAAFYASFPREQGL